MVTIIEIYTKTIRILSSEAALMRSMEAASIRTSSDNYFWFHAAVAYIPWYVRHSILSNNLAFVAAGCISNSSVNYDFYLAEFQYVSPHNYTIPPTSCPQNACGIEGFVKIPQCTSLFIRVSYFGNPLYPHH